MVALILVVAVPTSLGVARYLGRCYQGLAELLTGAAARARAAPKPVAGGDGGTQPRPVRITAVLVLDRSLLVTVTPHGMGVDAELGEDQVLLGEMFEPDGGAAVAVLNRWQAAGTPVVMELGSNRLTFQAHRGSSIVLAAG